MAEAILEARNVSKWYPRRSGLLHRTIGQVRAVDGVHVTLGAGETVGLVGESGCGKTTLAKLLVGLLEPSSGDLLIRGQSFEAQRGPARLAARRAVQIVFQDPMNSLNPRMTVEETLSEPLRIHHLTPYDRSWRVSARARRTRVVQLLAMVQLPSEMAQRLPRELSGGERQRVCLARALAVDPSALICDEPIASLDVSVGAKMLELLRRLVQERGLSLLFISHDLRAVASLCQRIAVMRQGRLVEEAPTDELLSHPGSRYTELLIASARLDLDAVL